MAEGLIRDHGGEDFEVFSAGTKPSIVRPEAIAVMEELSIDLSDHRSKSVDEFEEKEIDFVLTVCNNAKENCPYFPAKTKMVHHAFPDPADVEGTKEKREAAFREVRDLIRAFVPGFIESLDS